MPGPEFPDAPPPEVPEEFAAAYREAYQRALESAGEPPVADLPAVAPVAHQDEWSGETVQPEVPGPTRVSRTDWLGAGWLRPLALAALALLLVLAAYAVGAALSGNSTPDTAATRNATTKPAPRERPARSTPFTSPGGWTGPVRVASIGAISADCTAPPSQDSAGRPVSYEPENAIDHKPDTAWRCLGTAVGQKLTLRLGAATDVAELGIIPGYAKTDPESGADRYAENNRITKVRWTMADGVSVVQTLDPAPSSRRMQMIRVPRTTTDTVTLEILAVARGSRNITAISEISLAAAR